MGKGLAVFYYTQDLMKFLRFYCMEGDAFEWDALCLQSGRNTTDMKEKCKNTGIFCNIYTSDFDFETGGTIKKISMSIQMLLYAILNRRKQYCQKILQSCLYNINDYDVYCSRTEIGLITGMLASLADEKRVIYFDEGVSDYWIERKRYKTIFSLFSLDNIMGVFVSNLGYFAYGYCCFKPLRNCEKYAVNPEKVLYRNYKRIKRLSLNDLQIVVYNNLISNVYPELKKISFDENDAVLFTEPKNEIYINSDDAQNYIDASMEYVRKQCNNVYIKKHPRDMGKYNSTMSDNLSEIDQGIPGECLLPLLRNSKCFFMGPSSIIMEMNAFNLKPVVLEDVNMQAKPLKREGVGIENTKKLLETFVNDNYEIYELDF